MKKIKHLLFLSLIIVMCSSFTFKNSSKFTLNLNITPGIFSQTTYEFPFGTKFMMATPDVYRKEDIDYETTWTVVKTKDNQNYQTINSQEDFKYLTNFTNNEWQLNHNIFAIFPIENYLLDGETTFMQIMEVTNHFFGIDTNYESQTCQDMLMELVTDNKNLYSVNVIDNDRPVIDGYVGVYVTSVDNPASLEEIKSHLHAYDEVDGDLTEEIKVDEDNYSENSHKVGEYDIKFSVSDKSNNTAHLTIKVSVVDVVKPIINISDSFTSKLSEPLSLEDIKNKIEVSDNYDKEISYTISKDEFSGNENAVGTYKIEISATDSSNNTSTKEISINVVDDIKPTISGTSEIKTSIKTKVSIEDIKKGLIVNDNYDELSITDLVVESDSYSDNYNQLGNYEVKFSVSDKSNNKSETFIVLVKVVDEDIPYFTVDDFIINVDYYASLNHEQIIELLSKTNIIDLSRISNIEKQVVVSKDEYQQTDKEGNYKMTLKVTYDDGEEKTINLSINKIGKVNDLTLPWYIKTWNYLVNLYKNIVDAIFDFFDNLFHKIKNIF